ncbi:MAG: hypothetical protein AAF466_00045 [Bacteroidota bacterium]
MKTRIILILFVSVLTFSFTTVNDTATDRKITPQLNTITVSNIADLEAIFSDGEEANFFIPIEWTGDATYGRPNYMSVRQQVLDHYNTHWNKFPLSNIIDNNHEIWMFTEGLRADVESAMSKDDNVDVDDD